MRRIHLSSLAVISVAVLGVGVTGCSNGPSTGMRATLTYCAPEGYPQQLDVYSPIPAPTAPVRAVVYVHGGGWTLGDDTLSPFITTIAEAVVASGAIFVSVNYRLAPRFPWPAQIEDVKCAIRFLRHDAKHLHIDPRRIGALGDSAGGQLVSMLAVSPQNAGFDVGQYTDESSSVQAVVDLYGPADLTNSDWTGDTIMQVFARGEFGQPLGHPTPELVSASAVDHAGGGDAPFLIVQGRDDTVVPPHQSQELASRLTAAGDPATLIMVQAAGHGLMHVGHGPISPALTQLTQRVVEFLSKELTG